MALVIFRIFLLALPFLLFYFWMRYLRKVKKGEIDADPKIEKRLRVFSVLTVIGVLGGIVYLTLNSDTNEYKNYVPPTTIDGEIKPGHFEDEKEPKG